MKPQSRSSAYLQSQVMGSSPEQLVPLLYEHLLTALRRAGVQIERGDIEGKAASLEKASGIVFELLGSLDADAGGELAARLSALYAYFINEIATVGRSLDRARLQRLVDTIEPLHGAWQQAAREVRGGTDVAPASVLAG